jgi:UDP-glucose 4-epimerase
MAIKKHVVVTGTAGFLGRHVARRFSKSGWRVSGIGYGQLTASEKDELGLSAWLPAAVGLEALTQLVESEGVPDLVFHSAGGASVSRSWEEPLVDFENTVGTSAAVTELLRRLAPQARLIYPSSAAVYGNITTDRIAERSPLNPMSPYGVHKAMVERLLVDAQRLHGLRVIIIRFFSLFGPGLEKQLIWDIVQRLGRGSDVLQLDGDGTELRDFMYAKDAARLVVHLAEKSDEETIVVNGGCGRKISVAAVARCLISASGCRDRSTIEFTGQKRQGDPISLVADTGQLKACGFKPEYKFEDGIAELLEWIDSDAHR